MSGASDVSVSLCIILELVLALLLRGIDGPELKMLSIASAVAVRIGSGLGLAGIGAVMTFCGCSGVLVLAGDTLNRKLGMLWLLGKLLVRD